MSSKEASSRPTEKTAFKPVPNPFSGSRVDRSNFFGYIWFVFTYPIFLQGYRNGGITPEDIGQCSRKDTAQAVSERLRRLWMRNVDKCKENANLTKTLFCAFSPYFIVPLMISLFEVSFRVSASLIF